MVPNAEEALRRLPEDDPKVREEHFNKLREDPRVTRVGRFLRKTSLDELRGETSLVGPRPHLPRRSENAGGAQNLPLLRPAPGVTGLWQVAGRNQAAFEGRVQMYAHHVRDWSVWLGPVILARTARTAVFGKGAYGAVREAKVPPMAPSAHPPERPAPGSIDRHGGA